MAAKGTCVNPVTIDEEEHKALDLITPVLGARRARDLIAALWNIERHCQRAGAAQALRAGIVT